MSWKKRPAVIGTDMTDDKAQAISRLCHFKREKEAEWPCPKCSPYNIVNYDQDVIRQMRVCGKDCGWYSCRDGSDDKYHFEIEEVIRLFDLINWH